MVHSSDTIAVVLAGGQGSRFWPLSRVRLPKQFLSISDDGESLIQATVRRVEPLVGRSNICVVANDSLRPTILEHVPHANVIVEPEARNTAACIGLAAVAALAAAKGHDPVLVVLPADHAVKDEARLRSALSEAVAQARENEVLVTIGIPPTHPNTGYGYIKRGELLGGRTYRVDRFYEKPNLQRAERYLEAGGYSWNSGMFVWRASVVLEAFKEHLPAMYEGLLAIRDEIERGAPTSSRVSELFSSFESISIDFGILEHARNCLVIDAEEFGWNDVGSWDQWAENFAPDSEGNLLKGDALAIDSAGCVVRSQDRLIAVVGLKDVVVIDSGDALLVVSREHVQDVRKVVTELKQRGRSELI
jgi:mannose-1-phosphate guanylyltransferase